MDYAGNFCKTSVVIEARNLLNALEQQDSDQIGECADNLRRALAAVQLPDSDQMRLYTDLLEHMRRGLTARRRKPKRTEDEILAEAKRLGGLHGWVVDTRNRALDRFCVFKAGAAHTERYRNTAKETLRLVQHLVTTS